MVRAVFFGILVALLAQVFKIEFATAEWWLFILVGNGVFAYLSYMFDKITK